MRNSRIVKMARGGPLVLAGRIVAMAFLLGGSSSCTLDVVSAARSGVFWRPGPDPVGIDHRPVHGWNNGWQAAAAARADAFEAERRRLLILGNRAGAQRAREQAEAVRRGLHAHRQHIMEARAVALDEEFAHGLQHQDFEQRRQASADEQMARELQRAQEDEAARGGGGAGQGGNVGPPHPPQGGGNGRSPPARGGGNGDPQPPVVGGAKKQAATKSKTGLIVGCVLGGVAGIAVIVLVVVFCCCRK
ncbi:unnamed protein product [Amoebophrya sp. A25]|nr:unnamed protein product [Amoebophrya sp. A25]|eukprot:GSA25T00007394001.1